MIIPIVAPYFQVLESQNILHFINSIFVQVNSKEYKVIVKKR